MFKMSKAAIVSPSKELDESAKHKLDAVKNAPQRAVLRNRTNIPKKFAAKSNEKCEISNDKENPGDLIESNANGKVNLATAAEPNAMDVDEDEIVPHTSGKIPKLSLRTVSKEKNEEPLNASLPANILSLTSGLYWNVTKRLCLQLPFRCANELTFCYSNHYWKQKPEPPYHTQVSNLRCTWQQARYVEFINTIADMCTRSEFPGVVVFKQLIELVLITNYERNGSKSQRQAYVNIVRTFRLLVNTFPPCWLAMRPYYIKFFRQGLDIEKLVLKTKDIITNSNTIVSILFDLIEYTFANYCEMMTNSEELGKKESSQDSICESAAVKSQCFTQWNWDELDSGSTAFCNIKTDSRLERINLVLGLLLHILENDLCMWILQHHRSHKEFIFNNENAPLVILVFEMSQAQRSTRLVKRLFHIFSKSVAMDLSQTHLKLLERWISLVMVASHTADLGDFVAGLRFPALQPKTRDLIKDFYRHFKEHNRFSLDTYFTCINLLRIPYVKYEFIDLFLQMFHYPANEPFTPSKISKLILQKNWLKYKPKADFKIEPQEKLTREQYFELTLKALNAYCDLYGLEKLFQHLDLKQDIAAFQTFAESLPKELLKSIALEEMSRNKSAWLRQLRMETCVSRSKVDFPNAETICIDEELIAAYRNDLKHCSLLAQFMLKYAKAQSSGSSKYIDDWIEFANKYYIKQ